MPDTRHDAVGTLYLPTNFPVHLHHALTPRSHPHAPLRIAADSDISSVARMASISTTTQKNATHTGVQRAYRASSGSGKPRGIKDLCSLMASCLLRRRTAAHL